MGEEFILARRRHDIDIMKKTIILIRITCTKSNIVLPVTHHFDFGFEVV